MEIFQSDRGIVITESSAWTFDGHGRYRRTARTAQRATECLDGALEYGEWVSYRTAGFYSERSGELRVRVLPADRPETSFGLRTGVVLWTNLSTEPLFPYDWWGPADPWFEPSPVPADSDLWPGEAPFTAFGQFGPDSLDLRVFDQDTWWVDRTGEPHRLEDMDASYVANVIGMLTARAAGFYSGTLLREQAQSLGDTILGRVPSGVLVEELGVGSLLETEPAAWLESTPLMRRLRRLAI